jgi:signal transduction histidine kinase
MDTRGPLPRGLGRMNPLVVDAALALGLAGMTLIEIATSRDCRCFSTADAWWSAAFMLSQTLPLALRRRYPFTVFAVIGVSAIVYDLLSIPPDPNTAIFALLLALYSVSAYARRPFALVAAVITGLAFAGLNFPGIADQEDFASLANQILLLGGAWVVGQNTRYRRRQAELLRERASRTEREQRERERIAALEERGRLAREIHDVLAHSVSVIAVQAGAARAVADRRPERARQALGAIEEVSKQTMTELRRTIGVLRGPADELAMRPAPGLKDLDDLVERVCGAGVDVAVSTFGEPRDLPASVDVSAYRIVQEALTNVIKHAGPTTARIRIAYEPNWLQLVISDEGPSMTRPDHRDVGGDGSSAGGQGLIGIRERVAILGGSLEARPKAHGFELRARLPLESKPETR